MGAKNETVCFMLEPTGRRRVSLRRYRSSSKCSQHPHGYHQAKVPIGEEPEDGTCIDPPPHDDPRWPTACCCGEPFRDDDQWQRFPESIFRRVDTGEEMALREAPPGAMWDATWYPSKGPDGRALMLRVIGEWDWFIDGPASNGPGWTRSGEPPRITARPSIGVPSREGKGWRYHGFLTDGVLREC